MFELQLLQQPTHDGLIRLLDWIAGNRGEHTEASDLVAGDRQQTSGDHRVESHVDTADRQAAVGEQHHEKSDRGQQHRRNREQIAGRVHEHELHVSPAVAEAVERRFTLTLVVGDGYLLDGHILRTGLHDHLAGVLHAGRFQVQFLVRLAVDNTEPTVGVRDPCPVEHVEELRQHRVSDVLVELRHRPGLDLAVESAAHHHLRAAVADFVQ